MTIIETVSRKNFFSWILYSMGILAFIIVAANLYAIIQTGDKLILLLTPIIPLMIGILSLRMLLWFLRGKESISIIDGKLIITKTGTFWITNEKQFPLDTITKIVINKNFYEENNPSELVGQFSRLSYIFKIQNTGRIKLILSANNSYRILDNIEIDEAKKIIEKIKTVGNIN
jgi:hypothetical protein